VQGQQSSNGKQGPGSGAKNGADTARRKAQPSGHQQQSQRPRDSRSSSRSKSTSPSAAKATKATAEAEAPRPQKSQQKKLQQVQQQSQQPLQPKKQQKKKQVQQKLQKQKQTHLQRKRSRSYSSRSRSSSRPATPQNSSAMRRNRLTPRCAVRSPSQWRSRSPDAGYDEGRDWRGEFWWPEPEQWHGDEWEEHDPRPWQGGKGIGWQDFWGETAGGFDRSYDHDELSWGWQPRKGKGKGGKKRLASGGGGEVSMTRVHVANLPRNITEEALTRLFQQHGQVLGTQILTARSSTGQACAIVRYAASSAAEAAISTLNGKHEMRAGAGTLVVKYARPNPRWES